MAMHLLARIMRNNDCGLCEAIAEAVALHQIPMRDLFTLSDES